MPRSAESIDVRQRGFSLLELVVVIILVAILFLVAFDRLLPLRGDAEAAHVATVIGGLRSAVGLEAAARVTRDGVSALADLQGINPMTLLQEWPDGYVGVVKSTDTAEIADGSWYFHEPAQALVYRVRFPQYLEGSPEKPVELRWRVVVQSDNTSRDGNTEPAAERPQGVRLEPLDTHQWREQSRGRLQIR
ncbi:MAG: type II secretion system protein [Wenzhouxiangella sp.]